MSEFVFTFTKADYDALTASEKLSIYLEKQRREWEEKRMEAESAREEKRHAQLKYAFAVTLVVILWMAFSVGTISTDFHALRASVSERLRDFALNCKKLGIVPAFLDAFEFPWRK
jgi:hypothetical protein